MHPGRLKIRLYSALCERKQKAATLWLWQGPGWL